MNKKHYDFNMKKSINNPPEEWIIHENIVPVIVEPEIWNKANEVMDKRSKVLKSDEFKEKS